MQYVDVVVGGQYGSEAKGHVVAQLLRRRVRQSFMEEIWNVRVAGPNAGHTAYDSAGNKFAFRSVPIGAIIDDSIQLYIAPGSEIDPKVLKDEIELAAQFGHQTNNRFYISQEATVITAEHIQAETDLVKGIGSTGKGIGAARAGRIMRTAKRMIDVYSPVELYEQFGMRYLEPCMIYSHDFFSSEEFMQGVVIEGTQGYGLSLRASGNYPQVTSNDCRSVDFLAMAGIDPTRDGLSIQNWVVARVFPIRVAGNSGPLSEEVTWEELGLTPELTTVTKKVRRVGLWEPKLVADAMQANGGRSAKLVITMLDQVVPEFEDFGRYYDSASREWTGPCPINEHPAIVKTMDWIRENAPELVNSIEAITYSPTDIVYFRAPLEVYAN